MEEPLTTTQSDIPEGVRLILQSRIIEEAGKWFTCPKCHTKKHLLDWKEDVWKIVDVPRLRYICEKCNIVVVEASG